MKKVLFLLIVAFASILSFKPVMYAQSSTDFDKKTFVKSVVNASDADKLALENIKAANSKMYSNFSKKFAGARDIQSNKVGNHTMITCTVDGRLTRVLYRKNGSWQHTITTYENDKLPESVRELINDAYPRYSIFGGVIEVSAGNATAHLVTIENKTSWKRIRVVNGEMDEYEEHTKQ